MDCRDVGALANAGKCPLGLAWSILSAQYREETEACRIREVQGLEASLTEVDAWLRRNGKPPIPYRIWEKASWESVEMLVRPGGRSQFRDGRGRCRGVSHRFALYASWPKHHGKKYSAKWPIQSPP